MEKVKVNNQVVDMRKYVKQAKVHVINKLTKEVKLLQNRKGNEVQIQKAKRKADRFLEELTILKKIKPDDISKLALIKAKNWKEILQQKNVPLQERCTAMLANYDAVQKAVEAFHSTNKELVLNLADLIKQWEVKKNFSKNLPKSKISQKTYNSMRKGENLKLDGTGLPDSVEKSDRPFKNKNEENELPDKKKLKMTKENIVGKEKGEISLGNPKEDIANQLSAEKSFSGNDKLDSIIKTDGDDHDDNQDPTDGTTDSDESDSDIDASGSDTDEKSNSGVYAENTLRGQKSSTKENSVDAKEITKRNDESDDKESSDEENSIDVEMDENNDEKMDASKSVKNHPYSENRKDTEESKNVDKFVKLDASEFIKKYSENSSKNKSKSITLLNLDELQGLDEIPISNSNILEESDENKTSEDETNETFEGKRNDPFFLGCGGDSDGESVDDSYKEKDFLQKSDRSTFESRYTRGEKHQFSQKNRGSYEKNHKKSFQKFPLDQKKNSVPFRSEKEQPRNHKFRSKDFHDKFQDRNRRNFKNSNDSKMEHKSYPPPKDSYKNQASKPSGLYQKQSFGNPVMKNKSPHKKDITSDKPLHPSWQAKRKQKETIGAQFQGKRMVFDD